jgi:hypothetical protein
VHFRPSLLLTSENCRRETCLVFVGSRVDARSCVMLCVRARARHHIDDLCVLAACSHHSPMAALLFIPMLQQSRVPSTTSKHRMIALFVIFVAFASACNSDRNTGGNCSYCESRMCGICFPEGTCHNDASYCLASDTFYTDCAAMSPTPPTPQPPPTPPPPPTPTGMMNCMADKSGGGNCSYCEMRLCGICWPSGTCHADVSYCLASEVFYTSCSQMGSSTLPSPPSV